MNSDNGWVKGDWGQPGHLQTPSNVTRIARAIKDQDNDHHQQIVYYQAGIGTGIGLYNQIAGGGTGMGLGENVREAYVFLASNYAEHDLGIDPDSIFLLGFSRGAYTARSLGGLIGALGLLRKSAMPHFCELFNDWEMAGDPKHTPQFWDSYFKHHTDVSRPPGLDRLAIMAKDKDQRDAYIELFKRHLVDLHLTQIVRINCIGVWDTVGSLGIPVNPFLQRVFPWAPAYIRSYKWFDTRLSSAVTHAFHALALDERRSPFSPAIWERDPGSTTTLKQVWFPGAHSNVGGSYDDEGTANITLAWMMDQLAGHTTEHPDGKREVDWIAFDEEYIDLWYGCAASWHVKHLQTAYRGWAKGRIYDSSSFPQSLLGNTTRSPGRYHGTFYETGKTDTTRYLHDTNEYVHSCVRARIDLAGRGIEPDWAETFPKGLNIRPLLAYWWRKLRGERSLYQPQKKGGPLHEWRLKDGHTTHRVPNEDIAMESEGLDMVKWVYTGKEALENKEMPEDRLGRYERLLLQKDPEVARKMEFTNDGWRWLEQPRMPVRSAKTF